MLLLTGGFKWKIRSFGSVGIFDKSCGVIKINCLCSISLLIWIKVSRASFRATGSRKTSNSSITRKGVSRLSPMARSRERVAKLLSPPLNALTSLV